MVSINRLLWDPWNVGHIARHEVTPAEVEQVCTGAFITRQSYAGRLLLIGPTYAERVLAVVLEPLDDGAHYVVTARPASRRERRRYQEGTNER